MALLQVPDHASARLALIVAVPTRDHRKPACQVCRLSSRTRSDPSSTARLRRSLETSTSTILSDGDRSLAGSSCHSTPGKYCRVAADRSHNSGRLVLYLNCVCSVIFLYYSCIVLISVGKLIKFVFLSTPSLTMAYTAVSVGFKNHIFNYLHL